MDPLYDVNGIDGVNHEDFDDLVYGIFGSFYGDANLDQSVDLDDLIVLTNNLGNAGSGWVQGDFNGDGRTGLADLHSLRSHFGRRYTADQPLGQSTDALVAVPEPASGLLAAWIGAVVDASWSWRRSRQRKSN